MLKIAAAVCIITLLPGILFLRQLATHASAQNPSPPPATIPSPSAAPSTAPTTESAVDFTLHYHAAQAILQEAYRHVRMTGTQTLTDAQGQPTTEKVEFLRQGDRIRISRTVLKTTRANWPAGSISLIGGNIDKFFLVTRKAGDPLFSKPTERPVQCFPPPSFKPRP